MCTDPTVLNIYLTEMHTYSYVRHKTHTGIFIAALFIIASNWKLLKSLLTRIKKLVLSLNEILYTNEKT